LGQEDGLAADSSLYIVKSGLYMLSSDQPGFTFEKKDLVGSFKVSRLDARLAEGKILKEGFYDRINVGDTILVPGQSVVINRNSPLSLSELYQKIRNIH